MLTVVANAQAKIKHVSAQREQIYHHTLLLVSILYMYVKSQIWQHMVLKVIIIRIHTALKTLILCPNMLWPQVPIERCTLAQHSVKARRARGACALGATFGGRWNRPDIKNNRPTIWHMLVRDQIVQISSWSVYTELHSKLVVHEMCKEINKNEPTFFFFFLKRGAKLTSCPGHQKPMLLVQHE